MTGLSPRFETPHVIKQRWFHLAVSGLSIGVLLFGINLAWRGPSDVGSPFDASFYVVVPLTLLAPILALLGLLRFPYRVTVSDVGLELDYLHRRRSIPRDVIRTLEIRGDFVTRNVWLIRTDGSAEPLGVRNASLARAWDRTHE